MQQGQQGFGSLMVMPGQRMTRYPLLLMGILQCMPKHHPDFAAITAALKDAKEVCVTRVHLTHSFLFVADIFLPSTGVRTRSWTRCPCSLNTLRCACAPTEHTLIFALGMIILLYWFFGTS